MVVMGLTVGWCGVELCDLDDEVGYLLWGGGVGVV